MRSSRDGRRKKSVRDFPRRVREWVNAEIQLDSGESIAVDKILHYQRPTKDELACVTLEGFSSEWTMPKVYMVFEGGEVIDEMYQGVGYWVGCDL